MIADALWRRTEAAVLRTGMEDALARQFDKSVEPGFLCSPAEHLCKYLAKCVLQAEYAKMDLVLYLDICKFGICGYAYLAYPLRELHLESIRVAACRRLGCTA